MVSLDDIRDQLRDALAVLKEVMADPVPADELFFVRDEHGFAHVAGLCVSFANDLPSEAKWECVAGSNVTKLTCPCPCLRDSPDALKSAVTRVKTALNSKHPEYPLWSYDGSSLFSTFPAVFEAWDRVYRLYFRWVATDPALLKVRALQWRRIAGTSLPLVGVCTVQYKYPARLVVFPNGASTATPLVTLPEHAARNIQNFPDNYILLDVDGWPAERVSAVSTLLRDAGSYPEALAAFKVAEQLVP